MQVNKFVTMTVGLVVGVLLIAGVVAPVIANVSSDDGGSTTTTLRNDSGDTNYYFKPVTQSTHIEIVSGSSPDTIYAYVGGSATQEWSSHLVLAGDTWTVTTSNDGNFWMSTTDGRGYTVYGIDVNGSEVTLNDGDGWVYPENVRYYSWYEGDYVVSMSSSTGRQVVPYLASDSQSYISMGFDDGSRVTVVGSKDSNSAHYVYEENYDLVFEDLGTADVSIENNKLKSVTCTYNSVSLTFDWNSSQNYIAYAIVPVEVTVSDSDNNNTGSLRNGYWKMAESGEWDLYVDYLGHNVVGLFFDDPTSSEPFYEIELVNGESYDILPIMIGESFFVCVPYDPYMNDWEPFFTIYSEEGTQSTEAIHVNGTSISYYTEPGDLYVLEGAIMHISDEGGYTAYTTENPMTVSYSAFEYLCDRNDTDSGNYYVYEVMGTVDDSAYMWSIGSRGIAGTSTDGNIPWDVSTVSYIRNNGHYEGISINGSFDSESLSENIPFGIMESYDENAGIWVMTMAFAVGPIDNGGGSGGSGLSPTLTTILSVIPLVLTVGLVLGAVTYLRMKN